MRIAIVDDSKAMRRLQRDVIAELKGVEILEAEDGIDAIHKLRDIGFQVDLMLVDWVMPRMDGLTFVSQLKSHPNLRHIPILMVTSCADETRIESS